MKKTLIITLEYPPQIGGIATYVHEMSDAFDPTQTVVYAPVIKDSKVWDEKMKYKIIRKNPLFPRFVLFRWTRLLFQIWRIVKKEQIEIIFINHVLPVGYVGWIIKKLFKIPYLIISHGTDVLMGTRNKWKTKMMRNVVGLSEQIVFNSESLRRRFLERLPEFESKTTVLYPCPDSDFLIPPTQEEIKTLRRSLALEGKKVILSIARLDEGKGFPHVVRALPKILEREPHTVWIIIGDGPKRLQITEDIQAHSLQNVVRYLGKIPHEQLKVYYYLADLFVLLTHTDEGREEGLGLVFLEAAATGLPVVAGKSGGVEEGVLHTQTGIVIDIRRNAIAVVDSIVMMLQNKKYATQLGKNAQERIKRDFKWEDQLKKLDKWIR